MVTASNRSSGEAKEDKKASSANPSNGHVSNQCEDAQKDGGEALGTPDLLILVMLRPVLYGSLAWGDNFLPLSSPPLLPFPLSVFPSLIGNFPDCHLQYFCSGNRM